MSIIQKYFFILIDKSSRYKILGPFSINEVLSSWIKTINHPKNGLYKIPGYVRWKELKDKSARFQKTGICYLDEGLKNGQKIDHRKILYHIYGWFFSDPNQHPAEKVFLKLSSLKEKKVYMAPAYRMERKDVATHFKNDLLKNSGWLIGALDFISVKPGVYNLSIVEKRKNIYLECNFGIKLRIY